MMLKRGQETFILKSYELLQALMPVFLSFFDAMEISDSKETTLLKLKEKL